MKNKKREDSKIILYKGKKGSELQVRLDKETVWLSQRQMAELFDTTYKNISLHINNVYREKELNKNSTIKESLIVQKEGKRMVERKVKTYNLDVIISVGYRVKSKRGTEFRIWATKLIKEHIIKGYTRNTKRLKELQKTIKLLKTVVDKGPLETTEAEGLLKVITDFSYALDVLDRYDHGNLKIEETSKKEVFKISYEEARKAIEAMREQLGGTKLFGNEKDKSFMSSLNAIYQSFNGKDLYPSVEEKAAHLLYFVVKNHSFSDGNKRIGAFLFAWFLERNGVLHDDQGNRRIADNALVALTLMIAESKAKEKETMVKVVVSLINKEN